MEGKTILVVDDDADLRRAVVDLLAAHGFRTLAAGDGAEALRIVGQQEVDVILLDLLMPVMDGWEFAKAFAARPESARTPVIGFSALLDLPNSPVPPFVGFLKKPVRVPTLIGAIRSAIAG